MTHDPHIFGAYCNGALVLHRGRSKLFLDIGVALEVYAAL